MGDSLVYLYISIQSISTAHKVYSFDDLIPKCFCLIIPKCMLLCWGLRMWEKLSRGYGPVRDVPDTVFPDTG